MTVTSHCLGFCVPLLRPPGLTGVSSSAVLLSQMFMPNRADSMNFRSQFPSCWLMLKPCPPGLGAGTCWTLTKSNLHTLISAPQFALCPQPPPPLLI